MDKEQEFAQVTNAARSLCEQVGIELSISARVGYRAGCGSPDCTSCRGSQMPYQGEASVGRAIDLWYDPLLVTPKELFWTFLHELGHIAQVRSGAFTPFPRGEIDRLAREVDAWWRAEDFAQGSPYPPDQDFYVQKQHSLSTYGIAA